MKSSNLALRMDADEASDTLQEAAPEPAALRHAGAPQRPIFGPRAFEFRALERRAIVIRDSGLRLFGIRA